MPRLTRPLTNTEVSKAKATNKNLSLYDGDGLSLLIKPTGKKTWQFRYQKLGTSRRTTIALGNYPALSLADARELRANYLSLLAKSIDPQEQAATTREQTQIEKDSIFSKVSSDWFEVKKKSVTEEYAKDIWRSLTKDIFPAVENIPVQEIKARTLIAALEPIKARGALETVRRLIQRINEIMIYAVNTGLIDANPASGIGNAFERPKKQNMPALRPEELPQLMRAISMSNLSLPTRCLIEWQLLTLVRPAEASATEWSEINLEEKLWIIPAVRMKAKREHIVPLSERALELLQIMQPINGHRQYVFASRINPNSPMNSQTANAAIKRIGYGGKLVVR